MVVTGSQSRSIREAVLTEAVELLEERDWTSVIFGEGEEVPPELAEMWWSAFSDKLVGFDAEGEVVSPATSGGTGFRRR